LSKCAIARPWARLTKILVLRQLSHQMRHEGCSRRGRKKPALREKQGGRKALNREEERGQRHFFHMQRMVAICQFDATCF